MMTRAPGPGRLSPPQSNTQYPNGVLTVPLVAASSQQFGNMQIWRTYNDSLQARRVASAMRVHDTAKQRAAVDDRLVGCVCAQVTIALDGFPQWQQTLYRDIPNGAFNLVRCDDAAKRALHHPCRHQHRTQRARSRAVTSHVLARGVHRRQSGTCGPTTPR